MKSICNIIILLAMLISVSCSGKTSAAAESQSVEDQFAERGSFSADSAYSYVKRQVDFGPRVPGSDAHKACRE